MPIRRAVLPVVFALIVNASMARAELKVASEPVFSSPPDEALLAKIKALAPNTWLKLPPPKVIGDLAWLKGDKDYGRQGPRVRDYCNKMVWAPERHSALYCGAGHNIHPYNDVWEYDLAANAWICVYGADPAMPRSYHKHGTLEWHKKHVILKDGFITSPRGAPLRPAHTWWGLCYDSGRKRMVLWDAHKGLMFTNRANIAKAVGLDPKDPILKGSGSGAGEAWVFAFDAATRTWDKKIRKAPKAYESSQLEYLTHSKTLLLQSGSTYLSGPSEKEKKVWTKAAKGLPSAGVTAYDPESKMVVAVCNDKTYHFDCEKNSWTLAVEKGPDQIRVPAGTFCYDTHAKRFVMFTAMRTKNPELPKGPRTWLYDHHQKKWTQPKRQGDYPAPRAVAGYFDPARNVTVIYSNGHTWVYRGTKAE